jgi:hypothetical protein
MPSRSLPIYELMYVEQIKINRKINELGAMASTCFLTMGATIFRKTVAGKGTALYGARQVAEGKTECHSPRAILGSTARESCLRLA